MRRLLKSFLEENIATDYSNEKFDYNFNDSVSIDTFNTEFKKFFGLYNSVFYHNNRFVTIINSYEIRISKIDIKHIFNLYLYAQSKNLKHEKILLIEFLYTYFNTINTNEYKQNYIKYDESKKDFKSVLDELKLTKIFFTSIIDEIYVFYKQLLNYGIKNEVFIDVEIINRIFNNIKHKTEYSDELIDLLVNNKNNLYNIIKYDNNINEHIETYFDYIIESLKHFSGYNYAKDVLFELDKTHHLNEDKLSNILNKYIDIVNELCKKLVDKKYSFIQGLSEIENLKKELIYILQNIESLNDIQKEKLRECLSYLLRLKRYLLSDEIYVNSEMHEKEFKQSIPSKEVDNFRNSLLNNKFSLYAASKVRFTADVGHALESYAKYPLQSIVSMYHIDSAEQVYSTGIEEKNRINNNFKKYYDQKGKEYTIHHPKLMNKLSENYYEELLRYLSKTFLMQQHLTLSVLGQDDFRKIINELKESISYDVNNDYSIVVSNILAIETDILKLLQRNNIEVSSDGFNNLNNLFEKYTDEDKKDGLMYLNYILYEKFGLNLRNNMMHGTMINSNLDVALLVSFSGLIFVSWLLNEKQ